MDDPFAQFDKPAQSADPFAQFDAKPASQAVDPFAQFDKPAPQTTAALNASALLKEQIESTWKPHGKADVPILNVSGEAQMSAQTEDKKPLDDADMMGQTVAKLRGISKGATGIAGGMGVAGAMEPLNVVASAWAGPVAGGAIFAGLNVLEFLGGSMGAAKLFDKAEDYGASKSASIANMKKHVDDHPVAEQLGEAIPMAGQAVYGGANIIKSVAEGKVKEVVAKMGASTTAGAAFPYMQTAIEKTIEAATGGDPSNVSMPTLNDIAESAAWGAILADAHVKGKGKIGRFLDKSIIDRMPDKFIAQVVSTPELQKMAGESLPAFQAEAEKRGPAIKQGAAVDAAKDAGATETAKALAEKPAPQVEEKPTVKESLPVEPENGEPAKEPEKITAAQYTDPATGKTTEATDHTGAAQQQGVTAPAQPELRETPEYTFKTSEGRTVTREEAAQIAKDAGQIVKDPVDGKLHSSDVEMAKPEPPKENESDVPNKGPGAAHVSDFEPSRTTGLKKATVKDERLKRGLESLPQSERQSEEVRVQKAEDLSDSKPEAGKELVSKIVDGGNHAITADDAALLLVERTKAMNERQNLQDEHSRSETTPERKKTIDTRLDEIEGELGRLDVAQDKAGSSWGRTGRMYQMMLRDDYTPDSIKRRMRKATGSAYISPENEKAISALSERILKLQEDVNKGKEFERNYQEAAEANRVHEATIVDLKKQASEKLPVSSRVLEIAKKAVASWERDAVDASKSLRERLSRASAGVDPTIVLDVARIMRAKIGRAGISLAEMSANLLKEFGETVKPYLEEAWAKANELIDNEGFGNDVKKHIRSSGKKQSELTPAEAKASVKADMIADGEINHKTVYDLARAHINAGVKGVDAVMAAVHSDVKEIFPDATERDVRRAFSEYGKAKFPSQEEDKKALAEYRTLTRLQESIDRLSENLPALKTGFQRDKTTAEIRVKQKQLNDLLAKNQGPPSPEKLASNMEARKTALRNQIADLDRQIQTGEKPPEKGKPAPLDAEGQKLAEERDAMKRKLQEIENAKNPPKTPEERYNDQRMNAIAKEMEAVQERIKSGNYGKPPKKEPPQKNAETVKAWTELKKAKEEEKRLIEKARIAGRSGPEKALDALKTIPHIVTGATITGHGTVGMITHAGSLIYRPSVAAIYWKNFARQFKLWAKEEYHDRLIYELENHPNYETWKKSGLSIDPGRQYEDYEIYAKWLTPDASARNKAVGAVRWVMEGGKRGFNSLKLIRMELAEKEFEKLPDHIKGNREEAMAHRAVISDIINKATGSIGKSRDWMAEAAKSKLAENALFAPRLYASRYSRIILDPLRTIGTVVNWANASQSEKHAAFRRMKNAGEFTGVLLGALAINQGMLTASGSSQKVNLTDPSKSDWLKFKAFGKVISADGGLLDPVRLIGQVGHVLVGDTTPQEIRGGKFDASTRIVGRYIRGKLNPFLGLVTDEATGSDFMGRPLPGRNEKTKHPDKPAYTWPEWIASRGPIPAAEASKDIYTSMRESGATHVQAADIFSGATTLMGAMTGAHIMDDPAIKKGHSISSRESSGARQ